MQGCGCPRCNESHLERSTNSILNESKIETIREKSFEWLRNDKTGFKLFLDLYIEGKNVAIECQGGQHFNIVEGFGGKEEFEKIKYRDLIKNKLCKEHNIKLIYVIDKKFKRFLSQKQFKGIYLQNVLLIEDIEKDKNILLNLING